MTRLHFLPRGLSAVLVGGLLLASAAGSPVHAQSSPPRKVPKTAAEQQLLLINHKLATIIIPSIEFRATTPGDALEYLRQESSRLDVAEPNPEARGVNIFLKLPAPGQAVAGSVLLPRPSTFGLDDPPLAGPAAARITLSMAHIPLLEALKHVAQQAGLKVKVEPYAVSLVPLTQNTDPLDTRTFRVPPSLPGNAVDPSAVHAID